MTSGVAIALSLLWCRVLGGECRVQHSVASGADRTLFHRCLRWSAR
jgi:hypothetical protein